jgi:hypothetical protein
MKSLTLATVLASAGLLAGCILPSHEENAALRMPRPLPPPRALAAYAAPDNEYPTVGGDILKGMTADATASGAATPKN